MLKHLNRVRIYLSFILLIIHSGPAFAQENQGPEISLISPVILKNSMSNYVILDARPLKIWTKNHIPGALSMSWEDYTEVDDKHIAYRMFPAPRMADDLGKMGIDENTTLAIYGDADSSWGGEGWLCWLFSYLGHQGKILVVDGGINAWEEQKFPLSKDQAKQPTPRIYHASLNHGLDIHSNDLAEHLSDFQIIDTRSTLEWLRGSIPGSVHIAWSRFYTGENRTPLSPEKTIRLLKENSVECDKPLVYFCTGGIRSGYAWMVHRLAGLPPARNYEGGMEAWKKNSP